MSLRLNFVVLCRWVAIENQEICVVRLLNEQHLHREHRKVSKVKGEGILGTPDKIGFSLQYAL